MSIFHSASFKKIELNLRGSGYEHATVQCCSFFVELTYLAVCVYCWLRATFSSISYFARDIVIISYVVVV